MFPLGQHPHRCLSSLQGSPARLLPPSSSGRLKLFIGNSTPGVRWCAFKCPLISSILRVLPLFTLAISKNHTYIRSPSQTWAFSLVPGFPASLSPSVVWVKGPVEDPPSSRPLHPHLPSPRFLRFGECWQGWHGIKDFWPHLGDVKALLVVIPRHKTLGIFIRDQRLTISDMRKPLLRACLAGRLSKIQVL